MAIDTSILTIHTALEMLGTGQMTPAELTEACQRQIEQHNPELNAFITLCDVIASDVEQSPAGEELASPRAAGLTITLEHIPLAIKDLYDLAGYPTTAGTSFFRDKVAEHDAVVVEKLKGVGALIIGKTSTHEIAYGVTGNNPHFGASRNPWDPTRIPGGSSSGSAIAVAAGMCMGALGTDTGGSIRIPAALCGIVGLKPTYGRVSLRGVFPLSWSLDHAGPMARSIRDVALMLQIMAGYDPLDPGCAEVPMDDYLGGIQGGIRGWRVAVAAGDYFEDLDDEVASVFGRAINAFEGLGCTLNRLDLSYLREAAIANSVMIGADASAVHQERMEANSAGFGADVRKRLEIGANRSGTEYALARRTQTEMIRRMEQLFADYDVLLMPTVPIPAPPIEGGDALEQAQRLTRFTGPFNLTGLPALSLPCGFTSNKLPIGLQIVSGRWAEAKVLQAGHAYETAAN